MPPLDMAATALNIMVAADNKMRPSWRFRLSPRFAEYCVGSCYPVEICDALFTKRCVLRFPAGVERHCHVRHGQRRCEQPVDESRIEHEEVAVEVDDASEPAPQQREQLGQVRSPFVAWPGTEPRRAGVAPTTFAGRRAEQLPQRHLERRKLADEVEGRRRLALP